MKNFIKLNQVKVVLLFVSVIFAFLFVTMNSSAQNYCAPGYVASGWDCVPNNTGYGNYGYSSSCPYGVSSDGWTCLPSPNGGYGTTCPAGTTLGADGWTCVINNVQCPIGTYLNNGVCTSNIVNTQCPVGTYLSPDGWSCIISNVQCPVGTYLSPDGVTCISNSIPTPPTYTCPNGQIVYNPNQCPTNPVPPTYTCPNGQIVNNPNSCGSTPIPPSYQCANGSIVNNPSLCPTSPVPPQFICPNGQLVANPSNCPVTPVPQTYICSNGQIVNNPNQCPAQIQYQTCWDGSRIPVNQSCPQQYQICWNGSRIPVTNTCPQQTQICWNGLAVPLTQSCPQQYQTCWDGSIIPLTQSCPVKTTTTIIVKKEETITKEHVVVTDLATKITQNSAQCNGIGLIAGKVNSNGWFEYGETTDLGKVTNSANIGNYSETPFSNIISGLKSDTRYYCRAVMSNKDGVYKGKIVSFRTLAKSKVVITYPTPKPSKKTETKTEFYCADGSIAVAKTVLVGETVNAGGKLLKVTIERSIPDLIQGSTFNYRITITNIADTKIEDVEAKILIPSEMSFVDATTSNGITVEGNTIKVPVGDLDKGANKVFILPVKIAKDAEVDKSVITTVYASYNLPVKGEQIVRDEVSSYMVGNIVKADSNNSTNSTTTHRSTLASILFPQTLLGWLILFAIILILVILIRNIRQWYLDKKRIKEETTIHHHIA